jgi:antitoxin ParD1/3/4
MTVKASISLTDSQDAFARKLVAEGRYPSVDAVLQDGLDRLQKETEERERDEADLRELLRRRREGPFLNEAESHLAIERMLAEERAHYDMDD